MIMLPEIFNESHPSIFNDFFNESFNEFKPKTNISKTDEGYEFTMSVPGLTKDDLKIIIKDETLKITYNKEEKSENHHFVETFEKNYVIPDDVKEDKIKAEVKDGVLNLKLPFNKKKVMEKVIEIN